MEFRHNQFYQDLNDKLENQDLSDVAQKSGIDWSILHHMKLGGSFGLTDFGRACAWLGKTPNDYFIKPTGESRLDTIHRVLQGYLEYKTYAESSDPPAQREKAYRTFLNDLKGITNGVHLPGRQDDEPSV